LSGRQNSMTEKKSRLQIFLPSFFAENLSDVDWAAVRSLGISTVYIDFDNTISLHGFSEFDEMARGVVSEILQAELTPVLFSNARAGRLEALLAGFPLEVVPTAKKPNPRALLADIEARHISPGEALVVGDQLLTDIAAANRAGVCSLLVLPRSSAEPFYIRIKRGIEFIIKRILRAGFTQLKAPSSVDSQV
jgi:HAD superfamily phosphatase (TIGR01668 family)